MPDRDRPRIARRRGFVFTAALAAAIAVTACRDTRPAGAAFQPPPTVVQLAVIRAVPIDDSSEYVGVVQSLSSTTIKPEVAGQITRIYVKSGDRVQPGTPLFQIDPRRQEATVSSQDAALVAQQAAVTYARQELDRARTLLSAGAISQQQFDQAKANAESADAQLGSLRSRLQEERVTLQYYEVKSLAEGTVGDIPIRVGMRVTSDSLLTTVDRNQALEVYVQVPVDRARDLRPGLPLRLLDGSGNPLAETTVTFISPRVDDQTQSILVKGRLSGASGLRSSQFVRARIVWRTVQGIVVPFLSVLRINGQPFVFVAEKENGHLVARQHLVRLGALVGNDFTVTDGLKPDEQIVVSGVQKLGDGARIRPA
jgi:RND family efflux transporter MFP subunit